MINPSINDIRSRYLELIGLLNDESHDIETIRVKTASLSMIIHTKYSILESESNGDPKKKLVTNKTINALKSSNEALDFKTFTASFSEINEAVHLSYRTFDEKISSI